MKFYDLVKKELDLVENEIEELIPKEPKEVYGMLLPFIKRGGKRIRPLLTLLCCKGVGGDPAKAVKLASLLEIFHSFTLIHDDICDNSLIRRGLPTLNVQYGVPIAINSGDALYTLLWKGLARSDLDANMLREVMNICSDSFLKVVEGQGIELSWYKEKKFEITEEEYYKMASGKTASLIALSCRLGAMIGGANIETQNKLKSFGEKLGIAFQIRDDVLNLIGDSNEYKKEIGEDITEGKRTLIFVNALKKADEKDRAYLLKTLGKGTKDMSEINEFIKILNKYGAIDYASRKADEFSDSAKKELDTLQDSETKEALLELADFITHRKK